jgi:hypothetical protein
MARGGFRPSTSVSPANSHSTFIHHRTYIVSILAASLNNQLKYKVADHCGYARSNTGVHKITGAIIRDYKETRKVRHTNQTSRRRPSA